MSRMPVPVNPEPLIYGDRPAYAVIGAIQITGPGCGCRLNGDITEGIPTPEGTFCIECFGLMVDRWPEGRDVLMKAEERRRANRLS